jgi:hypothetical protein
MITYYFQSVASLIDATETEQGKGTRFSLDTFTNGSYDAEWFGGIGKLSEYKETLKSGYLPAVKELSQLAATSEGNTVSLVQSVCGQFGDVSRYLNGEPECMFDFETAEENKYLVLNIAAVSPANMQASKLMKLCAAIFSTVNFLEAQGTRVKIFLTVAVYDKVAKKDMQVKVLIKDFDDYFTPSYHGLLIGHYSTVRGLMYSYLSIHNKTKTLGKCIDIESAEGETVIDFRTTDENKIKNLAK